MNKNIIIPQSLLYFCLILLSGCGKSSTINKELICMTSEPISIPLQDLEEYSQDRNNIKYDKVLNGCKIVNYVDSKSCSICYMKSIYKWDDFIYVNEETKNVEYFFIIDVRGQNIDELKNALDKIFFSQNIYFDTNGIFISKNKHISDNQLYHTFLLDKNNNIVLVGNPINNQEMGKLYITTINNMCENNGLYIPE